MTTPGEIKSFFLSGPGTGWNSYCYQHFPDPACSTGHSPGPPGTSTVFYLSWKRTVGPPDQS